MKTFREAKRELELRVRSLNDTIKFLKSNSYYEDYCQNCHNIMKVNLRQYGEKRRFCTNKCRYEKFQKEKIKELENEAS